MKALIFLTLLFVVAAHAARIAPDLAMIDELNELPESVVALQSGAGSVQSESKAENQLDLGEFSSTSLVSSLEGLLTEAEVNDKKKWPIRIATKHLVKPDSHGAFVRQFWRFQARSKDIKGLKYLSLSKVAGDNIVWVSYAVYEDFGGLIKHARSEALRDFASYLTTANIAVNTNLIFRIAGGYYGSSNQLEATTPAVDAAGDNTPADNKKRGWPVRLLTAYIVRPGEHRGFIKAWEKLEKKVGGSKGLVSLTLNKPAGNNILFTSYAHLESASALWSLGEKKAVRDFKEYVDDHGITVVVKKLWKIPEPKW